MTIRDTSGPGGAGGAGGAGGRPRRPWTTWLLLASLALNIFVGAMVVGTMAHKGDRGHGPDIRDVGFGSFTGALSPADRRALRDAFIAAAPDFRERRSEAATDLADVLTALRADPWDSARVAAVLGRQAVRTSDRAALGSRLLLDRLTAMTPEERQTFAGRLEEMLNRRGGDQEHGLKRR